MSIQKLSQPPSGGCVLKQHARAFSQQQHGAQPPSGGCVLKQPRAPKPGTGAASRLRAAVC